MLGSTDILTVVRKEHCHIYPRHSGFPCGTARISSSAFHGGKGATPAATIGGFQHKDPALPGVLSDSRFVLHANFYLMSHSKSSGIWEELSVRRCGPGFS